MRRAFDADGAFARRRFLDRVDASVREASACGQRLAVLLVGLDRCGELHRSLEPDASAALRARAEERLSRCTGDGTAAVRLREDMFGLLLPRLRSGLQAREQAIGILGTLGYPFRSAVGIAVYPGDGRDAPTLLRCAGWALARARRTNRPTYCFYLRALATSAASSAPLL